MHEARFCLFTIAEGETPKQSLIDNVYGNNKQIKLHMTKHLGYSHLEEGTVAVPVIPP
jgi:hypothetical protein